MTCRICLYALEMVRDGIIRPARQRLPKGFFAAKLPRLKGGKINA